MKRKNTLLPIDEINQQLSEALASEPLRRLVIDAPTGSGKSTRVPQFLADCEDIEGQILVLQPRRLAARMLARRVAEERGGALGGEVGYHVRFDRNESKQTRIVFMTEGIFVRRVLGDRNLKGVGAVVLDEFHERHLDTDLGLALGLHLQATTRPDLALLIMSATLPGEALEERLAPCRRLASEGRTFPVEISYAKPKAAMVRVRSGPRRGGGGGGRPVGHEPVWESAARACRSIIEETPGNEGDILVFMPGGFEIRRTIQAIQSGGWSRGMDVRPLHGNLSLQDQDSAVTNGSGRRIIVSTNIAETSLTIPGVTAVVDSGLARISSYDRGRGINTLHIRPISKASADQRAGRAGRLSPGHCIRLWGEPEHQHRPDHDTPEIHRIDLSQPLLVLLASGISRPMELPWLELPHADSMARAVGLLADLGAVERPVPGVYEDLVITELGTEMSRFPAHPRIARMLCEAASAGCLEAAAICAAIVSEKDIFLRGKGLAATVDRHAERGDASDFLPRIRAMAAAKARGFRPDACGEMGVHAQAARTVEQTAAAFVQVAERLGWERGGRWEEFRDGRALGRVMLAGFSDQVAARPSPGSNVCNLPGGKKGRLVPETVLHNSERLVVAAEVIEIEGRALEVHLGLATAIEEALLEEVYPGGIVSEEGTTYDAKAKRVIGSKQREFRGTVLQSSETGTPDLDLAAEILAAEFMAGRLVLKKWDAKVEEWIARVNFLSEAQPEFELPAIDDESRLFLLTQICHGATSQKNLKDKDVWGVLGTWLSQPQKAAVESYAPDRVVLPNGWNAKVTYGGEGGPRLSAKVQDLYDLKENPAIAGGKVRLAVEVLGPNRRPVQTTSDIASFWENSYPAIRAQLKGRYPKHEWR